MREPCDAADAQGFEQRRAGRELDPLYRADAERGYPPFDQALLLGDEDGSVLLVADAKLARGTDSPGWQCSGKRQACS